MLDDDQLARATKLFNLANSVQNVPEHEAWAVQTKSALAYVLHGNERYELALEALTKLK